MTPLLEVRHLVKEFSVADGLLSRRPRRVVDDVTFSVAAGETLGLVGESGSGKTTTARCVLRLIEPTSGEVAFRGVDILRLGRRELRRVRRHMQIVFQDPYSSLNPRMRVGTIVEEPLAIHRVGTRQERARRVAELFELVGLDPALVRRYPHEFSGGQRQRIGIARAIALDPALIVADEPVASLDAPIQAQVLALLADLRRRLGLSYLFITHDLRLVRHIADRVCVMYRGRIVESAPAEMLFTSAVHPYTQALISAIPRLMPGEPRARIAFDASSYCARPLREVAAGHWAAV